jgi:hypothetical protein
MNAMEMDQVNTCPAALHSVSYSALHFDGQGF